MKCTECQGRRVTIHVEREKRYAGGAFTYTGRMVDRLEQCARCQGSGIDPDPAPPAGVVVYLGCPIVAPGFDLETFTAALERARARGTMPMIPAAGGAVLVESARTGARYRVTRATCSCQGHATAGHCMHRAAAIAANDLYGIDLGRTHVLGFDADGHPVTAAARRAQLQGVA